MLIEIIIILCAIVVIAWVANKEGVGYKKSESNNVISIKESLDLCNLPIITFTNNGNKYNFVLDSGSSESHTSKSVIDTMISTDSDNTMSIIGFAGNHEVNPSKVVELEYKDMIFTTNLYVSEGLDVTFKNLKESMGVTLHGIIGNDFLVKNGYILDFYNAIAYTKK